MVLAAGRGRHAPHFPHAGIDADEAEPGRQIGVEKTGAAAVGKAERDGGEHDFPARHQDDTEAEHRDGLEVSLRGTVLVWRAEACRVRKAVRTRIS